MLQYLLPADRPRCYHNTAFESTATVSSLLKRLYENHTRNCASPHALELSAATISAPLHMLHNDASCLWLLLFRRYIFVCSGDRPLCQSNGLRLYIKSKTSDNARFYVVCPEALLIRNLAMMERILEDGGLFRGWTSLITRHSTSASQDANPVTQNKTGSYDLPPADEYKRPTICDRCGWDRANNQQHREDTRRYVSSMW